MSLSLAICRRKWTRNTQEQHLLLDLELMPNRELLIEYELASAQFADQAYHPNYPAITLEDWKSCVTGEMSVRKTIENASASLDEETFLNLLEAYRLEVKPENRDVVLNDIKAFIRQDIREIVVKLLDKPPNI